jgi:hypothetical protein
MIELFFIAMIVFLILTFFYKQSIHEFRINQVDWIKRDTVQPLLQERVPLVIRGIPSTTCWSLNDVLARDGYTQLPIFKEYSLRDWIVQQEKNKGTLLSCPWTDSQSEQIARLSGISIWADRWINESLVHPLLASWWISPRYSCWTGKKGLFKTYGVSTCIFPVEGEILVSILPQNMKNHLPTQWAGKMPNEITMKDTPFFADLKYMDILLRPGTCLIMPPHWFVSWSPHDSTSFPMVCSIAYHTPISRLSYQMAANVSHG